MKIKTFPLLTVLIALAAVTHMLVGRMDSGLILAVISVAFAVLATTED